LVADDKGIGKLNQAVFEFLQPESKFWSLFGIMNNRRLTLMLR